MMNAKPGYTKAKSLVTTHQNADFDALAGTVAAHRLYPESRIVFPGAMNRNVRDFVSLHYEDLPVLELRRLDMDSVERLVVVDTDDKERILSLIHISEPTRLRRISYAVFCLKKKKKRE